LAIHWKHLDMVGVDGSSPLGRTNSPNNTVSLTYHLFLTTLNLHPFGIIFPASS